MEFKNALVFDRIAEELKIYCAGPSIRNRVLCSGMLLYLHFRNSKIFFHPAKFDNFKDETISDYKTVAVPQSQILTCRAKNSWSSGIMSNF